MRHIRWQRTPNVRFVAPKRAGKSILGVESVSTEFSSGRKNVTGTKLGVLGLAVLLACCLAVAGCGGAETTTAAGPSAGTQIASEAQSAPKPDVPLVIEAYYPLNPGHQFIADYLKSVEAANPGKVSEIGRASCRERVSDYV